MIGLLKAGLSRLIGHTRLLWHPTGDLRLTVVSVQQLLQLLRILGGAAVMVKRGTGGMNPLCPS